MNVGFYTVEKIIGRGAFGCVCKAKITDESKLKQDDKLRREVAIKFERRDARNKAILNESLELKALNENEHIVEYIKHGMTLDGQYDYLIMEYIPDSL
jgi:serine/threonine protein kinase